MTTVEKVSLEQFRDKRDQIKTELDALKQLAQTQDAEQKKNKVESDLGVLKNQLQDYLKQESDAANKQEAQEVLNSLSDFSHQLSALKSEVEANTPAPAQNPEKKADAPAQSPSATPAQVTPEAQSSSTPEASQSAQTAQPEEEKGFWAKTGDFISENWADVTSKDKRKEEPGKNALRVAGFVGTGVAIGMGVKKLRDWAFGDDEEKEKQKEKSEKKGFFDSTFGKVLKWTGITAGVGTAGYYLGKLFGWWGEDKPGENADATDSVANQAKDIAELKEHNPERFEKYQNMGGYIDAQYDQVMKKEIDAGWKKMSIADGYEKFCDKTKLSKEDFQATVPMAIDNEFSSVESLLSEGSHYMYLREKNFETLKGQILKWGSEKISQVLGPFLTGLTSFIPFKGKDRSESLKNWLESGEPADREAELQLFFRQYAKIINYTQDKLVKLKIKIATEKIAVVGGEFSSVEDALDDAEWVNTHIMTDQRFKSFLGGKLHQAIDVMKANGIFDSELSEIMKEQMTTADAQRDKILNFKDGKDALTRLNDAGGDLTPEQKKEALEVCQSVKKDLADNFDKDWTYLYMSAFHTAINSDEKNIQEFLEHGGLNAIKSTALETLGSFEQKLASGQVSSEDIKLYKNQVNSYFAMKKEILIGAEAIQQMKSENSSIATRALDVMSGALEDFAKQTEASYKAFKNDKWVEGWLYATVPLLVGGSVIRGVGKWKNISAVERFGNFLQKSTLPGLARKARGQVMRRLPMRNLSAMPIWMFSPRYNISHGDQLLFQDILEGKVNAEQAKRLIKKGNSNWSLAKKEVNSLSEFIQTMAGKSDTELPAKYLGILFDNKSKIQFMKNPDLRKLFFRVEKIGVWESTKVVWNGYRRKMYTPDGFHHVKVLEEFMQGEAGLTSKFDKMSDGHKKLFAQLIEEGKFSKIEDLTNLTKHIDQVALDGLSPEQLRRLTVELASNLDDFSDVAKLQARVGQVRAGVSNTVSSAVDATTDALKNSPSYKNLTNTIDAKIENLKKSKQYLNPTTAKSVQINEEIASLQKLRQSLDSSTIKEIEVLDTLYTTFSKGGKNPNVIKNIQVFADLLAENSPELEKAIKNCDWEALLDQVALLRKQGKLANMTDEVLEPALDILKELKIKSFVKYTDGLFDGIKSMVKILTKVV